MGALDATTSRDAILRCIESSIASSLPKKFQGDSTLAVRRAADLPRNPTTIKRLWIKSKHLFVFGPSEIEELRYIKCLTLGMALAADVGAGRISTQTLRNARSA